MWANSLLLSAILSQVLTRASYSDQSDSNGIWREGRNGAEKEAIETYEKKREKRHLGESDLDDADEWKEAVAENAESQRKDGSDSEADDLNSTSPSNATAVSANSQETPFNATDSPSESPPSDVPPTETTADPSASPLETVQTTVLSSPNPQDESQFAVVMVLSLATFLAVYVIYSLFLKKPQRRSAVELRERPAGVEGKRLIKKG